MTDAHDIGLSVSYGNRRHQDARRGLDALAATLGKNVDDFAHVVAREMRVFIAREPGQFHRKETVPRRLLLHRPVKGYDEPEPLLCSNRQICPTSADVRHTAGHAHLAAGVVEHDAR